MLHFIYDIINLSRHIVITVGIGTVVVSLKHIGTTGGWIKSHATIEVASGCKLSSNGLNSTGYIKFIHHCHCLRQYIDIIR